MQITISNYRTGRNIVLTKEQFDEVEQDVTDLMNAAVQGRRVNRKTVERQIIDKLYAKGLLTEECPLNK